MSAAIAERLIAVVASRRVDRRHLRRPLVHLVVSAFLVSAHAVLLRAMAHGHVAHVLLGAGNSVPPLEAAALAIGLVLARLATVLVVPGLVLAAVAELVAHALVGPPRAREK